MTGLHLGLGLNVVADEYKSDVDVLGKVEYATGGEKWTFTGPRFDQLLVKEVPASHIVVWKTHDDYGEKLETPIAEYSNHEATTKDGYCCRFDGWYKTYTVTKNGQSIGHTNGSIVDGNTKRSFEFICDYVNDVYGETTEHNCTMTDTTENTAFSNDLHADIIEEIISSNEPRQMSSNPLYDNKEAVNISPKIDITNSVYVNTSKQLKARTNKIGGELKMSYFHNLTDHVVLGVDVCGTLNQKAKKNIGIDKLNYTEQPATEITSSGYQISYNADGTQFAKYVGNDFTETNIGSISDQKDTVNGFFKTVTENGATYIPERQYTIDSLSSGTPSTGLSQIIADNPGYTEISNPDPSQYLQISNEKGGDVSFEKNKFNSRAAVVLGAQYKGWFAGVRGGVSYNQGKLHVKDSTGTSSEEVSFASPFVGVHLMKSVNMKGLEN